MRMTAIKPKSFAKRMESNNNKRLIQTDATTLLKTTTLVTYKKTTSRRCVEEHIPVTKARKTEAGLSKQTRGSLVGTIADHRMTNNNRIRKKWDSLAVTLLSLIFVVHVTVVNGHAEPVPAPIRVSHSYTKTVINNSTLSSTTSRSSTITTPFLASDAIIPPTSASSVIKNSNSNNNNNANYYDSRSARNDNNVAAARKDYSTSSVVTSIDRPFFTKITSNDAVYKPTYFSSSSSVGKMPTKRPKKNKSPSSKYPKMTTTQRSIMDEDEEEYGNASGAFIPHTTEKAYHPPPKLSLEPFFNFLTSLATASREVLSKEHEQQHKPQPAEHTSNGNNKYSPSYETINQSIREGAKRSKKSKKGKGKKGNKGRKGSKKDKGSSSSSNKRHRLKSEEEEDEEQTSDGPIPIPLPNPIIDSIENEEVDDDAPTGEAESPGGLHILDVLRTPMIPDYESPPPRAEKVILASDYHEGPSGAAGGSSNIKNSSSSYSGNPPSGRANMNKGQGYLAFDKYDVPGTNSSGGANSKQQQRGEPAEQVGSFHEHNSELQGQESISHTQVVSSPYGINGNSVGGSGGLVPSHQYQQQHQANDLLTASSSQVSTQATSPEFVKTETTDIFGQPIVHGKDDMVSKYPTTFVYRPGPPPHPGARPFLGQSPLGMPPNAIFGPPPQASSRPSLFRMNKQRPNLHSYYDPTYHNYAGAGEHSITPLGSNMFGIRHAFGPPHFRPPPHHRPPMPPPRFGNVFGNRPSFLNSQTQHLPHGSHYVGHTLTSSASSKEPITKPYDTSMSSPSGGSNKFQDITGTSNLASTDSNPDLTGGSEIDPSASETFDQYVNPDIDEQLASGTTGAENSETKKVGIMESFDLFYKEYKILTWAVVFFATSLSFLALLVYLYINNPPTEVVQARELFPWDNLFKSPQILNFLSSIAETGFRRRSDKTEPDYLKPYGQGFGAKSGRQKRKQTRTQQDKQKFRQRRNKISRRNNNSSSSSTSASTTSTTEKNEQSTLQPTTEVLLQGMKFVKY